MSAKRMQVSKFSLPKITKQLFNHNWWIMMLKIFVHKFTDQEMQSIDTGCSLTLRTKIRLLSAIRTLPIVFLSLKEADTNFTLWNQSHYLSSMVILKLKSITRKKNAKKLYKKKLTARVTKISHAGVVTMTKAQNMRNRTAVRDKINTQKAVSNMINLTNNNNMVEKENINLKKTSVQYTTKKQIRKRARSILNNFLKENLKKSQDLQIQREQWQMLKKLIIQLHKRVSMKKWKYLMTVIGLSQINQSNLNVLWQINRQANSKENLMLYQNFINNYQTKVRKIMV